MRCSILKLKIKYLLPLIAVLLFIIDIGLTAYFLIYTSYAEEGNPLFYIDAGYLSLVVNLIYLVIVFVIGHTIEKYESISIEASNSFDYFKKLYKTDRTNFIYVSSLTAFVYATFASRVIAILDWVMYGVYQRSFYSTQYAMLREKMPLGRYDLVAAPFLFLFFIILWYKFEFIKSKKNKKKMETEEC